MRNQDVDIGSDSNGREDVHSELSREAYDDGFETGFSLAIEGQGGALMRVPDEFRNERKSWSKGYREGQESALEKLLNQ